MDKKKYELAMKKHESFAGEFLARESSQTG
jgi:hypothetical protein